MKQHPKKGTNFLSIISLTILFFSTFMAILFIMEFSDNYKIIKHEKEFKKIKVKIDSTKTSSTRSGKGSSNSTSTTFYFNKGCFLTSRNNKGIILNHQEYEQEIYEYMSNHQDSLYIWNLDNSTSKFAYEDQKNINISEEIENNKKIKIYILLYIGLLLLFIKFRNH